MDRTNQRTMILHNKVVHKQRMWLILGLLTRLLQYKYFLRELTPIRPECYRSPDSTSLTLLTTSSTVLDRHCVCSSIYCITICNCSRQAANCRFAQCSSEFSSLILMSLSSYDKGKENKFHNINYMILQKLKTFEEHMISDRWICIYFYVVLGLGLPAAIMLK